MNAGVPDNFLGLDPPACDYAHARFAVLPVPYDATTSFGVGAREGPRAVITASQQVELYDDVLRRESWEQGVATLAPLEVDARGPEHMLERVYDAARGVVQDGKFLIGLGGEHSVTLGFVRAVRERWPDVSVLQIDAHADLRDRYQGTPFSHAAVMRRVYDLGVKHIGVGVRNYSREEAEFIDANDVPLISASDCEDDPQWIARAVAALGPNVYVTIDIDGFDPACAPGTGTPEPGGMYWRQVTDLLAAVAAQRDIVGCDLTEVRPLPPSTVTEFLAAKLLYRLIGLVSLP